MFYDMILFILAANYVLWYDIVHFGQHFCICLFWNMLLRLFEVRLPTFLHLNCFYFVLISSVGLMHLLFFFPFFSNIRMMWYEIWFNENSLVKLTDYLCILRCVLHHLFKVYSCVPISHDSYQLKFNANITISYIFEIWDFVPTHLWIKCRFCSWICGNIGLLFEIWVLQILEHRPTVSIDRRWRRCGV